ncbi:effector-associated constant component EACC1 [Amycolatopsis tucumanensis]|uniref:effector-associated constant component EACC1 n=1 Tax=Amycolatopsis tucumanensis TaxID=401106 RepID=UPI003D7248E9
MTLTVAADRAGDEARSLREWLLGQEELRGRVRLVDSPPEPGRLGSVVETLAVALGPGGVATATATVLIAWLRRRASDVTITVKKPDGDFELTATNVKGVDAGELAELTRRVSAELDGGDETAA